jgi:hypothetical protein
MLVMVGLTMVVLAFFSSHAIAIGDPRPRHVPVAVTMPRR